MRHMNKHMQWLTRLTAGDSGRTIAQKAGASIATINRQISKEEVTAENVILIARGYGQSPVEALAQTGYLEAEEVTGIDREALASLLTDQELIRALALRVDENEGAWDNTFSEVVDNVSYLPSNTQGEDNTPAVQAYWDDMPDQAVADDSPEEGGTPDDYEP